MKTYPLLLTGLLAALMIPVQAQSIKFFQDTAFEGRSWTIKNPVKRFSKNNDTASSLIVKGTWEVCSNVEFRNCIRVEPGSYRNLKSLGINDKISSARPLRNVAANDNFFEDDGRPVIRMFNNTNFRGNSWTYDKQVIRMENTNDKANSVMVKGSWQLCKDHYFRNCTQLSTGSYRNLRELGLAGDISSVRPTAYIDADQGDLQGNRETYPDATVQNRLVLYKDTGFKGERSVFTNTIRRLGANNDQGSSAVLDGTWEICRDYELRNCVQLNPGAYPNLQSWGLNDKISSLRPVN